MTTVHGTFAPPRLPSWSRIWRRSSVSLRVGAILLLLNVFIAAAGWLWTPFGYAQIGTGAPVSGMSLVHPFGVDQLGRDVLSRAVYASHIDILLSVAGALLGLAIGAVLGLLSGYLRGMFDEVQQRLNETLISIPFLVLALIAIAAAGPQWSGNPLLIIAVVALVYAPRVSRMARSAAIEIASRDFVTVARLRGEHSWSVWHELLPNATGVLLVEFALRAGYAPILIGTLGFLGFGMRPPTPEWGLIMSDNRNLLTTSPVTVLGPGLMLASLVVGLNLFTEGLARIFGRTIRINDA